jgi:perosamine synthetase
MSWNVTSNHLFPKIKLPIIRKGAKNAWFFAPILVENRDKVAKALNEVGVATRVAYPMPVYEQPFFERYREKNQKYDCPNAKWMTERVLNLPMFHAITFQELEYVADHVVRIIDAP